MKRWRRLQKRISEVQHAELLILLIADMDQDMLINCAIKRYCGKCKSPTNEECLACKLKWLNDEEEEKGELFKWMTH